jgi:hypothetical protein
MSAFKGQLERLARILHEAGRDAVEKRLLYRNDLPVKPFCEWDDLTEDAKEGRRSMARYLVAHAGDVSTLVCMLSAEND